MEYLRVKKLPDEPEWVYELKLDGYRAQAIREVDGVRLPSRNGKDLSKRFPGVVSSLTHALLPDTVVEPNCKMATMRCLRSAPATAERQGRGAHA